MSYRNRTKDTPEPPLWLAAVCGTVGGLMVAFWSTHPWILLGFLAIVSIVWVIESVSGFLSAMLGLFK